MDMLKDWMKMYFFKKHLAYYDIFLYIMNLEEWAVGGSLF
jgi:hypothetical protein